MVTWYGLVTPHMCDNPSAYEIPLAWQPDSGCQANGISYTEGLSHMGGRRIYAVVLHIFVWFLVSSLIDGMMTFLCNLFHFHVVNDFHIFLHFPVGPLFFCFVFLVIPPIVWMMGRRRQASAPTMAPHGGRPLTCATDDCINPLL